MLESNPSGYMGFALTEWLDGCSVFCWVIGLLGYWVRENKSDKLWGFGGKAPKVLDWVVVGY